MVFHQRSCKIRKVDWERKSESDDGAKPITTVNDENVALVWEGMVIPEEPNEAEANVIEDENEAIE